MRAILEFNLPQDQDVFNYAKNAHNIKGILFEYEDYLKSAIKYSDDPDKIAAFTAALSEFRILTGRLR